MKNNRPVFESFQDFVEQIFEKQRLGLMTEEDVRVSLNDVANTMSGDMQLTPGPKSSLNKFFENLETYLGEKVDVAEKMKESILSAFEILKNEQKGVSVTASSSFSSESPSGNYKYLINGEVKAKGIPDVTKDPMTISNETERIRLYDLLGAINAYNFMTFSKNVKMASELKNNKKVPQYSGVAPVNPYLQLVDDSATTRTIEFIKPEPVSNNSADRFEFNVYSINKVVKGSGDLIERNYFDEVIKPGGAEIEVKEKPYNSSGIDFFEENDVVISASGISALKAIISEFNKITEIKVNGSASSKPTSREGGNEKLAADRRAAGMEALKKLKGAGIAQLNDADIVEGTASVQAGASKDSDPAMQQVSFIVSGKARKSEIVDAKPVTITKVENIKADQVSLKKDLVQVFFAGDITNS
jgi:hypothetical protein